MPFFIYWDPKSQRWLPSKQLQSLLKPFYKPPKQHGKKHLKQWQKLKQSLPEGIGDK